MSQALDMLNSLSETEIDDLTNRSVAEGHVVIGFDRIISVPPALRRIAVEHDHNMETVTFDCPRYWDNNDMSTMAVYINYMLSNGYTDQYPVTNLRVDTDDDSIMHFDWTISNNVTQVAGKISFLVCVVKTDTVIEPETGYEVEGVPVKHWNSELNQEMYVSAGLECESQSVVHSDPDLVARLLECMPIVENIDGKLTTTQNIFNEMHGVMRNVRNIDDAFEPATESSNLLNPDEIERDVILSRSGTPDIPAVGYMTTGFISVYEGDELTLQVTDVTNANLGRYRDIIKCWVFYGARKEFISYHTGDVWDGSVIVVPKNAWYVRVSYPDSNSVSETVWSIDRAIVKSADIVPYEAYYKTPPIIKHESLPDDLTVGCEVDITDDGEGNVVISSSPSNDSVDITHDGEGNVVISRPQSSGDSYTVDTELSTISENPVQNKVVAEAINKLVVDYSAVKSTANEAADAVSNLLNLLESVIGLIEFTIDGDRNESLTGLTWGRWLNSNYPARNGWAGDDDIRLGPDYEIMKIDADGLYYVLTVRSPDGVVKQFDTTVIIDNATYVFERYVFTFRIDGKSYSADPGMMWSDWIYSENNTDGYVIDDDGVVRDSNGNEVSTDGGETQYDSTLIVTGVTYVTITE